MMMIDRGFLRDICRLLASAACGMRDAPRDSNHRPRAVEKLRGSPLVAGMLALFTVTIATTDPTIETAVGMTVTAIGIVMIAVPNPGTLLPTIDTRMVDTRIPDELKMACHSITATATATMQAVKMRERIDGTIQRATATIAQRVAATIRAMVRVMNIVTATGRDLEKVTVTDTTTTELDSAAVGGFPGHSN